MTTKIKAGVIGDGVVGTTQIADDAISQAKIADDAVGADQLASSAVVTASIADGAITSAKLDTNIAVGGTLGVTGETTMTGLTVSESNNGDPVLGHFYNDNAGTATEATVYITNSSTISAGLFLETTGSSFTTVGGFVQDGGVIGTGAGASGGLSIMTRANADMRFYTNGHTNERLRIQAGGGISFNGDTAAANALDDYEEGTFTPSYTVGGGGSVTGVTSTNVGAYTKVGRMCTVTVRSFYVATSGTIPTYYRVTLPFTAATITNGMTGGGFGQETGQSGAGMMIKVDSGQTSAIIWKYDGTAVPANSYFELMFTYMTA